ncbi:FadR/GntR family transcriptional regulator [Sphingobacterium sp. JB170]|uniref:FadR/GntR family transcriptional regulator n=1 Tax=Sphingobacterium sp. JB170 TaxID=1434842 RepID=UPI00097E7A7D|nr:FadR/GntR family transcriptional regulator [Sphingobacterium sp. JB170]SJN47251.1 Transcriptional regulator, GntR family [Sphingobacterium sp. JB170]
MLKKTSLAEEVATRIRQKIRGGVYLLDAKLPTEPELMHIFGVGRSSVREAIRILANGGYVEARQGKGTFVLSNEGSEELTRAFRGANLDELLEVRYLLEGRIVEKAALNRTSADVENIGSCLAQRKRRADAGELPQCIAADIEFHQQIANACGNSILAELYSESCKHMQRAFIQLYVDTSVFIQTHGSHEELYNAIKDSDVARARTALGSIIEHI